MPCSVCLSASCIVTFMMQSPVVRRLYCYVFECLGWCSCFVLCLGRYSCYVSKYCGSVLSNCPVCLVHGFRVSLCNGRELPVLRNSQCCCCFIFYFLYSCLWVSGVRSVYHFWHCPFLLVEMRPHGVLIESCLPLGLLCNI